MLERVDAAIRGCSLVSSAEAWCMKVLLCKGHAYLKHQPVAKPWTWASVQVVLDMSTG